MGRALCRSGSSALLLVLAVVALAAMPCGVQAARAPYRSRFMTAKKSKLAYEQPSAHMIRSVPDVGVLCSMCCVSTEKQDVPPQMAGKAERVDFKYSAYSVKYDDAVYVWQAEGRKGLIPGTSHVVWVLKHNNFLFNLAAALNAWRTWTDMGARPTRVLLLRPPRPSYEWMYRQLRGLVVSGEDAAATTAPPPRALRGVECFERAVLGHVKKPMRPFDWTTTCKRQPKATHEETRLFQGFSSYIQRRLQATPAPIIAGNSSRSSGSGSGSPPQCRAVVQLRGSADGREPRGRNFLNAAEASGALGAAGFVVEAVDLRTTQMEEAAKLHGAADVVVAVHGAGVANAVFCRPGTTLVELQSWGAQKWVYERISRALGLRYRPIVCSSPGQCPLGPEEQQQQQQGGEEQQGPRWESTAPSAMHDLCRRGIRNQQFYATNHTRDIRVDVSSLLNVLLDAASGMEAAGRCRLLPPPPPVAHDGLLQ